MPNAGALRCYVTLQRRKAQQNALDEKTYDYENWRSFWAQIVPQSGRQETIEGNMDRMEVTHRVICREEAVGELAQTDMRFVYRAQTYKVLYWYPNYKRAGYLDFYCRLVVGNEQRI